MKKRRNLCFTDFARLTGSGGKAWTRENITRISGKVLKTLLEIQDGL